MIKFSYKKDLETWHNLKNVENNPTRVDGKRNNAKGALADLTRYTTLVKRYVYTAYQQNVKNNVNLSCFKNEYVGDETIFQEKCYKFNKMDYREVFYKQKSDVANKPYNTFIADYIKNNVNDII